MRRAAKAPINEIEDFSRDTSSRNDTGSFGEDSRLNRALWRNEGVRGQVASSEVFSEGRANQ